MVMKYLRSIFCQKIKKRFVTKHSHFKIDVYRIICICLHKSETDVYWETQGSLLSNPVLMYVRYVIVLDSKHISKSSVKQFLVLRHESYL